jgi:hypothetical protein
VGASEMKRSHLKVIFEWGNIFNKRDFVYLGILKKEKLCLYYIMY